MFLAVYVIVLGYFLYSGIIYSISCIAGIHMKLPQISNGTSMGIYYNADVVNLGITGYNYCNFLFHFLLL